MLQAGVHTCFHTRQVYLERILSQKEVEAFAKTLKPHQMALLPDGSTVLERAVVQHNIQAASKLYNNISLQVEVWGDWD